MRDHRQELVAQYRAERRAFHRLRQQLRNLCNELSLCEERSADLEASLAHQLDRLGPIEVEGRRYTAERRGGLRGVAVAPVDSYLMEVSA